MTAVTKEAFVPLFFALLFHRATQEVTVPVAAFVFRPYDKGRYLLDTQIQFP